MIQMTNALKPGRVLSKFRKKETIASQKRLDEASHAGDASSLKVLLEEDKLLLDRTLNEVRDNPLHIAAFHGHVDFASEILELKPELAKKLNKEGQSPLHLAAARGHLQVVEKLLDQVGTDICLVLDKAGYLPIHTAAIHGKNDVVAMFIDKCQQTLHEVTSTNETLLHLAVKANSLETIRFLMSRGVKLNAKDDEGNTCLHIAVARRNSQVIKEFLHYMGEEINSMNVSGQTPLDVLCESWQYFDDVSLVNMIRNAGGLRAAELTDLKSICIHSSEHVPSRTSEKRTTTAKLTLVEKNHDSGETLLIVATLVATITFQAVLNPPGGFVQGDSSNTVGDFLSNSYPSGTLPAGIPVLLIYLKAFYTLDTAALFASVSVILLLLCKVPENKFLMNVLVWVVWLAVFCTALAFSTAFIQLYSWDNSASRYILGFIRAWLVVLAIASLWVAFRVIYFFLRYGALNKGRRLNWLPKFGWPKLSRRLKMAISIISIVIVLAILLSVNYLINYILI
ncbi:Ankyrin repeat family protein [Rhynchospora pubera]|uniref:Ankyrin repeat family protein n=1 Tax=Rhynchospora pubera TaxID=906938 RepID=A0AAV8DTX8_9POAL|nr:Ankyrin repeat family protein [Rhynchospora pubera]